MAICSPSMAQGPASKRKLEFSYLSFGIIGYNFDTKIIHLSTDYKKNTGSGVNHKPASGNILVELILLLWTKI